jgi:maltooligosyltrehalose trehalohydrolase
MQRAPGAVLHEDECEFFVWAPHAKRVQVQWENWAKPSELAPQDRGYFHGKVPKIAAGALYRLQLDDRPALPDPASRRQPQGVHGPSEIVSLNFQWNTPSWSGLPLHEYVIYELHVGTFSSKGTFAGVGERLDELKSLGITAVELMPVAQFPGDRNWGYDGVYPYAVQSSYGSPADLMRLVDACHQRGLAVILDVVYNHLGPEGNYLGQFGDYFTDRYRTPWGQAINFDGPHSDEVRQYFIGNALYWLRDFRIDALRLDAVHAIFDESARPFLAELSQAVQEFARADGVPRYLIEECDRNDPRHLAPIAHHGLGLDGVWNDDFHHAVHCLLTGEDQGYYRDFGNAQDLEKVYQSHFIYTGQYSPARQRRHGADASDLAPGRFVVCVQNHDQVGNRAQGDRLHHLADFEATKLAAGLLLLSPFMPLIFMGQEHNEANRFLYFTSHSDEQLIRAVRTGRREEFAAFAWQQEVPDPQAESTFQDSRTTLLRELTDEQQVIRTLYQSLLELRRNSAAMRFARQGDTRVQAELINEVLHLHYPSICEQDSAEELLVLFSLSPKKQNAKLPPGGSTWDCIFDSADARWLGPGRFKRDEDGCQPGSTVPLAGHTFTIFQREIRREICNPED